MADTGQVTQSVIEFLTVEEGTAQVTQSVVEIMVGVGILCNDPPDGIVGTPYTHTFPSGGGVDPLNFTITAGAVPPGLTLNAATGVLSGVPQGGQLYEFTVTVTDAGGGTASVDCSITVSGTTVTVVGGQNGQAKERGGCQGYNEYDYCMLLEMRRWRHITFPDICVIPKEYRNLLPWDEDFGAIPIQAVPFNKTGGIETPTTASGDNVVASFRVPVGYDGLLTACYFGYSGQNFIQGSGDILTRLRINQRFVKDLGNNPFLMGSPTLPLPLTEGQILLSGMWVQAIVNVPNLSGQIQIGASTIYAGLLGFFWPRG